MPLTNSVATQVDRVTRRFGYRFFPDWVLHPSQIGDIESKLYSQAGNGTAHAASSDAANYLSRTNPRLQEFRDIYAKLDEALKEPLVWTEEFTAKPDLTQFRSDNMWVHQLGHSDLRDMAYLLATYFVLANDSLDLMTKLVEDGAFGAVTFEFAGRPVSRDLLDSILEINFLERHLQLSTRPDFSILDIGAGYGRLGHRLLGAFPALNRYRCTDAIPESSFVCEYYLKYRGLADRFKLVPAPQIDAWLGQEKIDVAVNIHSFSECTLRAVGWWLDRLANYGVKHLMIVPNAGNHCGQLLRNNIGQDMLPLVQERGYQLIARENKYGDPNIQKFAMNPTCHWLFELNA
jgi:hypothetical protein